MMMLECHEHIGESEGFECISFLRLCLISSWDYCAERRVVTMMFIELQVGQGFYGCVLLEALHVLPINMRL